jgi:hypothetical protein
MSEVQSLTQQLSAASRTIYFWRIRRSAKSPLLLQTEEQISRGRRDGDALVRAVVRNGETARRPTVGRRKVWILLQHKTRGRRRPRHRHAVAGMIDGQCRCAQSLHDGNQTPESAGHGKIPAAHRAARVRLSDGSAHGIYAARAGAAATGYFIPVNGIGLRAKFECDEQ